MLGKDQPIILHLIEVPEAMNAAKAIKMELQDCSFDLLSNIVITSNLDEGFKEVDYAILVGAKPRGPGMERNDLIKDNGKIFSITGKVCIFFY